MSFIVFQNLYFDISLNFSDFLHWSLKIPKMICMIHQNKSSEEQKLHSIKIPRIIKTASIF